jgi:cellulose synthase/poly-beta-1,6-N-acetylglucosamine synthase-like glycosyltransferase
MGKVIYDLFFEGIVSWFVTVWFCITIIMAQRRFDGWRFERLERKVLAPRREQATRLSKDPPIYKVTSIVTCADEDSVVFAEAMRMLRQQVGLADHKILVMIDTINKDALLTPEQQSCLETALQYADWVGLTNARAKRRNLYELEKYAREQGMSHELLAFVDSDTVCDNEWVLAYLVHDLTIDDQVGGVTSSQRCLYVETIPERISDWLENARLKSSMAAASLYGQVGCLPGRVIMVKRRLVEHRLKELPVEVWTGWRLTFRWPFLERWEASCAAGDDRQITNFILEGDYKTKLVLPAGVKTIAPRGYKKMFKMWHRWGTSSQGYVYRTLDWLWKKPYVLYHYSSDILISHVSVLFVIVWLGSFIFGNRDLALPLSVVLMMSAVGLITTFAIRQWPHLRENPQDLWLLPAFIIIVTVAQFGRVSAHWRPWMIEQWGTRKGADDKTVGFYVEQVKP